MHNYHPWTLHKTLESVLSTLKADIACFQEVKTPRQKLALHQIQPDGYQAFFSFSKLKQSYSGVACFVRRDLDPAIQTLNAWQGLAPLIDLESARPDNPREEFILEYINSQYATIQDLDSEGRVLILDLNAVVLINVYCPHAADDQRIHDLTLYLYALEFVTRIFLRRNRNVILVGDLNVAHREIDHCDPQRSNKDFSLEKFSQHPPRIFLDEILYSSNHKGVLHDIIRETFPDRKGMYTCWNVKINARPGNMGTRIDYILISDRLMKHVKEADTQPEIMGSDHCPVYLDLSISDFSNALYPHDINPSYSLREICTDFWPELQRKQERITSLLGKRSRDVVTPIKDIQEKKEDIRTIKGDNDEKEKRVTPLADKSRKDFSGRMPMSKRKKAESGSLVKQTSLNTFFKRQKAMNTEENASRGEMDLKETNAVSIDDLSEENRVAILDALAEDSRSNSFERTIENENGIESHSEKWKQLFTPKLVPRCTAHDEFARLYTTKKKRIKPRPSILHVLKVGLTIFVDAYHVNVGQLDPRPKVVIAANIAVTFFNGSDIYTEMRRLTLTEFSRIEILGFLRWIPSF